MILAVDLKSNDEDLLQHHVVRAGNPIPIESGSGTAWSSPIWLNNFKNIVLREKFDDCW